VIDPQRWTRGSQPHAIEGGRRGANHAPRRTFFERHRAVVATLGLAGSWREAARLVLRNHGLGADAWALGRRKRGERRGRHGKLRERPRSLRDRRPFGATAAPSRATPSSTRCVHAKSRSARVRSRCTFRIFVTPIPTSSPNVRRAGVIAPKKGTNPWQKCLTWMRAFGENAQKKRVASPSGSPQHLPETTCLLLPTAMSAWRRWRGNASSPLANGCVAAGV
jgi:hypothetical protein